MAEKKYVYHEKLAYAKKKGFPNLAEALWHYGTIEFNKGYEKYKNRAS